MARINIEDSIYTDNRFFDLIMKVKDHEKAIGALVRCWIVAQKWFLTDEQVIPYEEWKKQGLSDFVIEVGLAEKRENGIWICGAEKQFAWLKQRVEAGRRGGAAQRGKKLDDQESARREGARVVLNKAIKSGKVIKSEFCEDCGSQEDIHGHHSDYSRPYDVNWLCRKCHNETHKHLEAVAKRSLDETQRTQAEAKPSYSYSSSKNNKTLYDSGESHREEFNLEQIYQEYPRRRGQANKGKGIEKLKKLIKNRTDFELALAAVRGYRLHLISQQKINTEFVKMFSSFWDPQGDWKEWAAARPSDGAEITDKLIAQAKGDL